jgi:hypothetical protein
MERTLFTSSHCTISELHALSSEHDRISQQLYVEEESLYHKHDTENKPYEAFNVLSNQTATKLKPKVMPERYMDDITSG